MNDQDQRTTLSQKFGRITNDTSSSRTQTEYEKRKELTRLLSGSLKDKPISWLLEVVNHYKATGHLNVGSLHHITEIHFVDGTAVHAKSQFFSGSEAVIELFGISEGKIKFDPDQEPGEKTINESGQELKVLGEEYAISLEFLQDHQIDPNSILKKEFDDLSDQEVERILNQGVAFDKAIQLKFYKNIDGKLTLKQLGKNLFFPRSILITLAANLLRLGLVLTPDGRNVKTNFGEEFEITDEFVSSMAEVPIFKALDMPESPNVPPPIERAAPVEPALNKARSFALTTGTAPRVVSLGLPDRLLEYNGTRSVMALARLIDEETGVYDQEMFQFFLEKEFTRAFRFGSKFALLLFSITTNSQDGTTMPAKALTYLLSTVNKQVRDVDITGQMGNKVYGFILPSVDSRNACNLAKRVNDSLFELAPELKEWEPKLHFGASSVPNDAKDITSLIETAQKALFAAYEKEVGILAYPDL